MAVKKRVSGAWVDATVAYKRVSGAWVAWTAAKTRSAGAWVDKWITAALSDQNLTATALSPADATISYNINTSGTVTQGVNGGAPTTIQTWLAAGSSSDYCVRADIASGSVTSGTIGSWLQLSSGRAWTKSRTSNLVGTETVTLVLTLGLWNGGSPVTIDTASITLNATVES